MFFFFLNANFIKAILRLIKNFLLGVEGNYFGSCTVFSPNFFTHTWAVILDTLQNDINLKFTREKNCFPDILEKITCVLVQIYVYPKEKLINSIKVLIGRKYTIDLGIKLDNP